MKITLTGGESLRMQPSPGMLTIEAPTPDRGYSPFHMVASGLGGCTLFVLQSWAANKNVSVDDLKVDISWKFVEGEHRMESASVKIDWPSLPAELWPRALLQMALFVGRNRKYVRAGQDVARWRVNDRESFLAREMAGLYDQGIPEPIISCHRVKVLCALEDELAASPDAPWADDMCAAVNRYLNTPMKRHQGLRTATQARDFIAKEG